MNDTVLGVDIGGSGMKAAEVHVGKGLLVTDRFRIETPQPATPQAMSQVMNELIDHFEWSGPIGCAFPGVIRRSAVVDTASNLDSSWVGVDAAQLFERNGSSITMINDADAAGLAEIRLLNEDEVQGVVFMLTIGTGLGTAIFTNGVLVPNTELGHLEIDGFDAEDRASSRARKAQGLSMQEWAARLQIYLAHVEDLFSPDLFLIGGGISKSFDEFAPMLQTRAKIQPAALRNHAGIVGAALSAAGPAQQT